MISLAGVKCPTQFELCQASPAADVDQRPEHRCLWSRTS
uniref:Uncharacterized protein n=1 Tax=Anguilla anguilla TaxID=7936 RepID=A0A0E9T743_ANGAN